MDGNVWFERSRVGLSAAACEREFFRDALRDVYFQTALQLGLPQWDLTEGAAVRAGRDCMMAAEALPFAAESMDLLLLPHALDDGKSCGAVADEAYRVLVAEGRLVLSGFNPHSVWRLLYRIERKPFPCESGGLPFGRLKEAFEAAGFVFERTEWLVGWPLHDVADSGGRQVHGWPATALVYGAVLSKRQAGIRPLDDDYPNVVDGLAFGM